MDKFSKKIIIEELKKIKKGEWVIYDKPKKNEVSFIYSKKGKAHRVYFNRYELRLAYGEKEIAEIVNRKMGEIPPTFSEITMIKLLEDL